MYSILDQSLLYLVDCGVVPTFSATLSIGSKHHLLFIYLMEYEFEWLQPLIPK